MVAWYFDYGVAYPGFPKIHWGALNMMVKLTYDEITILKSLMEHQLAWATYKTKYMAIIGEEKYRLLKDIETLTLLAGKFA